MMKILFLLTLIILILPGCSNLVNKSGYNSDIAALPSNTSKTINSNHTLHDSEYAKTIVKNVNEYDAKIDLEVWRLTHKNNSPSAEEVSAAYNKLGIDKEKHLNILNQYSDAIKLQAYLSSTPSKVLVNDDVILVIIPNSWLWAGSFDKPTLVAIPYIKVIGTYLSGKNVNILSLSYLNNNEILLNKQELSAARAAKFASLMTGYSYKEKGTIKSIGLGEDSDADEFLEDSTVLELRAPYSINSSQFKPKADINEFHWSM